MKRCFVIGNGPSLSETPLHLLVEEVTFATGRIHLLYSETPWRPTYYVQTERLENVNVQEMRHDFRQIVAKHGTQSYIQEGLYPLVGHMRDFVRFTTCVCALKRNPPKSWHLPEICSYGSSVHAALQIAVNLGYTEIILLGCDLTGGHFAPDYGDSLVQTDLWRRAHEIAQRSCPVLIYNATLGGDLEVYPRIDLWSLLKNKPGLPTATGPNGRSSRSSSAPAAVGS